MPYYYSISCRRIIRLGLSCEREGGYSVDTYVCICAYISRKMNVYRANLVIDGIENKKLKKIKRTLAILLELEPLDFVRLLT